MDLFANHCRLCRTEGGPQDNWTQLIQSDDGGEYLLEKIQACTGVWIHSDDVLPKRICPHCKASLELANSFRMQCQEADAWWSEKMGQAESVYVKPEIEEHELVEVKMEPGAEDFDGSDYEPAKEESSSDESVDEKVKKKTKPKKKRAQTDFRCGVCDKQFRQKATLQEHEATHGGARDVECTMCDSKFYSEPGLKRHMDHKHSTKERPYECDHCDRKFSYINQLKSHQVQHSDVRPFSCKLCPKKFKTPAAVNAHMRWTHQPPEVKDELKKAALRPCVCPYCGKVSTTVNAHKMHLRIHTGEKNYECNICDKRFTACWSLQKHMLVHTGERPYVCEHCQKAFRQRHHLKTHIRGVHTNERPFPCRFCPMAFVTRQSMQFHEKTHGKAGEGVAV